MTTERYEREIGRTVSAIVDRITTDGRVQARTYGQADEIDGVTWLDRSAGIATGDIIEVSLDAVVNDVDFEATLVRRVSERMPQAVARPRVLPVMSTAGAFGR